MTPNVVCRILGNELLPRDLPGSRLKVCDYILNNEHLDSETKRVWILNRILDTELLAALKTRLRNANEKFVEIGVDWDAYVSAHSRCSKINVLVGINHARNEAFKVGARIGTFVFVLDGDCFFDRARWLTVRAEITRDQLDHPERKHYAIPIARVFLEDSQPFDIANIELEEPILVFRNDAEELFDELGVFGYEDKVELLRRLGIRNQGNHWYPLNSEGLCLVVGTVLHLCTGARSVETDGWVRYIQRRESLNLLLRKADALATRNILTSSATSAVFFTIRCRVLTSIETLSFSAQKCWFHVKYALRKLFVGN